MVEISAGVGGQEAMLFAQEVYTMYCGYAQHRGWECECVEQSHSEMGKQFLFELNIKKNIKNFFYNLDIDSLPIYIFIII